MPKPKKAKKTRKTPGRAKHPRRATAVLPSHVPGAPALVGSDERLLVKKKMAWENRMKGMNNFQNAEAIQKELGLPELPSHKLISSWVNEIYAEVRGDLDELAKHELMEGVEKLKQVVNRFLPMALGGLHISRMVEVEGQMVEVIDERAYIEQSRAAEVVGKNLMRIQDILNGASRNKDKDSSMPGGLKAFQQTLIMEIRQNIYNFGKEDGVVLSLDGGEGTVDDL